LLKIQACADQPQLIPRYDRALLRRELDIFPDWFIGQLLGYSLSANERELLAHCFTLLEDSALHQRQCLVHRDYHSRNLLLCDDGNLGVIDFQGALWGAATYDVVSLLRDCYKRLPEPLVYQLAEDYRQLAMAQKLIEVASPEEFRRQFDWMGLQRHIKVLGIFARLKLRDNKPGYLKDLPLVMRYTLEVAAKYPQFAELVAWFEARLLPLAEAQPWYRDYRNAGEDQ